MRIVNSNILNHLPQILEDKKPFTQTAQHWYPHVHFGLSNV